MITTYYRVANVIIIYSDISNHESFDNLNKWISDVKKFSNVYTKFLFLEIKLMMRIKEKF